MTGQTQHAVKDRRKTRPRYDIVTRPEAHYHRGVFVRRASASGKSSKYPSSVADTSNPPTDKEDQRMKHLMTGVAIVAALAFCAPASAQPASPSGGNAMGMPGPNPGGPGLTPYTTGPARPAVAPAPMAPPPPAASTPPMTSDTSSATPPKHRHARTSHGKMAGHHATRHGKGPQLTGSTANQLNREELARLQAGNFSNPPAPPAPPAPRTAPPPTGSGRMPGGGQKVN